MKKITFILLFVCMRLTANSQVTDSQIAHAILGKHHYEIAKILDSLNVWYHLHTSANLEKNIRSASIANSEGIVKVYTLWLDNDNSFRINEVVINYRHDSKEQVENSLLVTDASDYHVGIYSTDLKFYLKKSDTKIRVDKAIELIK